jgi:sodium-dependent dicarboxylate transporter 2/3/5
MESKPTREVGILAVAVAIGVSLIVGIGGEIGGDAPLVSRTAAVALLMAILWITEAVPLAVTALLPVALFPPLGVLSGGLVASQYFNWVIFLFIGGFMVALAMERWNLHRRIALRILMLFGVHPRRILLGFMVATAFLSMWISNTATAMMMVTIAIAIIRKLEESLDEKDSRRFSIGLLLGVAYGASMGGIATLVGTPPNLSFARIFEIQFPEAPAVSFASWFAFAFPVTVVFLGVAWGLLSLLCMPRGKLAIDREVIREQYRDLGPLSFAEGVVLVDFVLLVLLWIFRRDIGIGRFSIPGWEGILPRPEYMTDGTVAMMMALPLYFIPSRSGDGGAIMNWATTTRLPWNIVLLFGGGFALARGFTDSGLSLWVGHQLQAMGSLPPLVMVGVICLVMTFVTELTSNTATTEMVLPILAGLAMAIGVNPLLVMIPATLSASCAFMMPVATPPNAIVFGTSRLRVWHMARIGVILNLVGVILIVLATWILGKAVLGISLTEVPTWATK